MCRRSPLLKTVVSLLLVVSVGCGPQQPFYFFDDGDLSHYKGMATNLEVPDTDLESLNEVDGTLPPLTLSNSEPNEIWDLPLEEAVRHAMANSKVMRSLGATVVESPNSLSMPDSLTRAPDMVQTVYDPAVRETNPRFGVEAALAAFDAQLATSVFWEKNDTPRNSFSFDDGQQDDPPFQEVFPPVLQQDMGTFQAQLSKINAAGGRSTISHNVRYDAQNTSRRFPSEWNVDVTAEFRQPLLQGAGVQFNRIAGPGAIPGYNNGVIIARINTDIALADFEAGVRNLVSDVERAYWGLYLAYRELDAVIAGRDSSLAIWRRIHALMEFGARGGEAEKEAQAREQYFLFRAGVERKLSVLYDAENQLRYIMGLTATDGRLIRPADEPTSAKVSFDWYEVHGEGLVRNIDLRRQKWRLKQREMELIAAKNYLLPRLDAVGRYRWLGMGDHLGNANRKPGNFDNAYQELTSGDYQEWQLGLELNIPIGFRKELTGVRHAQLNLARERTLLQEQELEISHQIAQAIREVDLGQISTRTSFNRRVAAKKQVEAVAAAYEQGTVTLDLLLDTQRRLAEAEIAYYRSLVDYNLAITQLHFRKGSLLEYNGVYLAEGPWPGKAYFDARRRARARDAGLYMDYGFTRPRVISRGEYEQQADRTFSPMEIEEPWPDELEPIPTPVPEKGTKQLEPSPAEPKPPVSESTQNTPRRQATEATAEIASATGRSGSGGLDKREGSPRDLAAELGALAGRPTAGKSAVRRVSYEEDARGVRGVDTSGSSPARTQSGWKAITRSSAPHEPVANRTPADAAGTASSWKGVQH